MLCPLPGTIGMGTTSEAAASSAGAMTLDNWLERIGVEHPSGVLRGLDGVYEVAARLCVLLPAPNAIVVAGTNGKGSTVVFTEQLLLAAGQSVGTTTSPHIHTFNERIRLNGIAAQDARIVAAFEAIDGCRGDVALSYFEYAILAALRTIAEAQLAYAVLEVGLGGRLDAVNVVDADVAVITSIGLDHQEYLGETREAIGAEKAGILRHGVPLVVGEPAPPESVLARAAELDVPTYLAGRDFGHAAGVLWIGQGAGRREFCYRAGAVDPVNAATALQAAELAGCPIRQDVLDRAATAVRNPGRMEIAERDGLLWVVDVAHNPHAARFFVRQAATRFRGKRVAAVVGCLQGKDLAGIVAALQTLAHEVAFADTVTARGRSATSMRAEVGEASTFAGTLDDAAAHVSRPGSGNDVILICGSFDLVERARIRLKLHRSRASGADAVAEETC